MQTTRSGLAAAAAKMQLTETPEGKSSLQNRLNEAERRAREAEVAAQGAQATLARTLLEAARVEAVVTARVKAESEAAIEALRSQLDAAKCLSAPQERETTAASPGEMPAAGAEVQETVPAPSGYRPVVLTEWDRPVDETDGDSAEPPRRGIASSPPASMLSPLHMVLPAVAAVFILAGYDAAGYFAAERAVPPAPVSASGKAAEANGANWLLYMPVERAAISQYLGGNAKPRRQLAVTSTPTAQQRN